MDLRQAVNAAAIIAMAALVIAAVMQITSSGGAQQAEVQTLKGGSFATAYQASWSLTEKKSSTGFVRYQLSSSGAQISGLGIPATGSIGITVDEAPTSALKTMHLAGDTPDTAAARQNAVELLPHVVGVPGGAQGVALLASPRTTSLGEADAAEESYMYKLAGHEIVQVDVLSSHDGRIVLIELDAEAALMHAGQRALETITGHWRWD